jgi:hypothetical protein
MLYFTNDLSSLQLADDVQQTWMQGFPLGEWMHPVYGKIKMTQERVARFVKNFNDNVRQTELDVDYDHKDYGGKAAGWIRALQDRQEQGLWMQVEWTPSAYQSLQDREYRYFSPEFTDTWKRPSDGQVFKDVLFGGAITNRPFLKGIMPINLSDFPGYNQQGDEHVEELLQRLAELLGLTVQKDATPEQLSEAITGSVKTLQEKAKTPPPPPAPPQSEDDRLKKLAEKDPAIQKLLDDREEDKRRLDKLEAAHRLSEVTTKLADLNTDKFVFPPAFADEMRNALVQLNEKSAEKVIEALKGLMKTGIVELGERGSNKPRDTGDAVKKFTDRIAELQKDNKELSYREAVDNIGRNEPELWEAYSEATLREVQTG